MKKKICSIVGGRPQIFKIDPKLSEIIVNTEQHYDDDMAGVHFRDMKIVPKYNLGCTSDEIGKMIDECRKVLQKEKPDIVLVYGDTYSTLAGAVASSLENIPIGHVEAGLRAHDKSLPEETNRIVADVLATYRFAPCHLAVRNLQEEGLGEGTYFVGDTLFWSMNYFTPLAKRKNYGKYIFASIHRRENLEPDVLKEILEGLGKVGPVYLPLHPHTRRIIKKNKLKIPKNIEVVKPQPRKRTLEKIYNSRLVITDSGGIQREAYWIGKHSLIVRTTTEWMEIVGNGWATLVPASAKRIEDAAKQKYQHAVMPDIPRHNPFKEIAGVLNA